MRLLDTFQNFILMALNRSHRPEVGRSTIYQGTVDPALKAKRRAKNKVARRSRRINRMVAKR